MGLEVPLPKWASDPCIMGIDEAGRGPVLGPMVYGCLYCALSYQKTLSSLKFAVNLALLDFSMKGGIRSSKTLKEEKREELFENLKADESRGVRGSVLCGLRFGFDPPACMWFGKKSNRNHPQCSLRFVRIGFADVRVVADVNKINLNEISHNSAMGLVSRVLNMGVLLTEFGLDQVMGNLCLEVLQVYVDIVGDPEKYRIRLFERFPSIKFVVAKKADSLYPVVKWSKHCCKVTRDQALSDWVLDETAENMHRKFGSGYPGDPKSISWLEDHQHSVFGFPTLVRFSWGTCTPYFKSNVEVLCVDAVKVLKVADIKLLQWRRKISCYRTNEEESILARITATGESDKTDEDGSSTRSGKQRLKLSNVGFTGLKRKSEEIESSGKGCCKFFQAHKLEQLSHF
ncbi:unnamed protein product [Camellia sinensis]